jgi:tetratricopeptide (TPR) repeat protein
MRKWIAVVSITFLFSLGLMGMGCDKLPWSKPQPKAEPQQPAPQAQEQKPEAAAPEAKKPESSEPGQEVKAHLKQGMSYVSIAKNATSKSVFNENLDNAIAEFSNAINKDPNYAEAYSNRAVAYMLQKKNNKALDDLKKAKELKPDSATIRYNLASVHSLMGNTDYGLDELDAALSKGFNDYESLRKDPDINNLRKSKEFKQILEKHKVFITK